MWRLWLTLDDPKGDDTAPPTACPHAGCGSGRVRCFQSVAKPVRGPAGVVTAARFVCRECGRTFRAYPAGIGRGSVPDGVARLAAGLHALGLPYRDVSRALAVLGVTLGKSRVHALAAPLAGAGMPRPAWLGSVFERVEVEAGHGAEGGEGEDRPKGGPTDVDAAAWVWIDGQRHRLRRAADAHGRAALVVDAVTCDLGYAVEVWAGPMLAAHGVQAAVVCAGGEGPRRGGLVDWSVVDAILPPGSVPDDAGTMLDPAMPWDVDGCATGMAVGAEFPAGAGKTVVDATTSGVDMPNGTPVDSTSAGMEMPSVGGINATTAKARSSRIATVAATPADVPLARTIAEASAASAGSPAIRARPPLAGRAGFTRMLAGCGGAPRIFAASRAGRRALPRPCVTALAGIKNPTRCGPAG